LDGPCLWAPTRVPNLFSQFERARDAPEQGTGLHLLASENIKFSDADSLPGPPQIPYGRSPICPPNSAWPAVEVNLISWFHHARSDGNRFFVGSCAFPRTGVPCPIFLLVLVWTEGALGRKMKNIRESPHAPFHSGFSRVPSAKFSEVLQSVVLAQLAHLRTMRRKFRIGEPQRLLSFAYLLFRPANPVADSKNPSYRLQIR